MKRELTLHNWAKSQLEELTGSDLVWAEAEELIRRKRLTEVSLLEGRITGRFLIEQQIVRAELIVPVFSADVWKSFLQEQKKGLRLYAHLLAGQLAWDEESIATFIAPAAFIPKDGGAYSPYTAALLIEFYDRVTANPFLLFELRGKNQLQVMAALGSIYQQESDDTAHVSNLEDIELTDWNSFTPPDLTYSLRADELPALLFKRIESIPLPGDTENVEQLLSELYVHIAKRAQAYGLTFKR